MTNPISINNENRISISIQIDKNQKKFKAKLNGKEAFIEYEMFEDEVMDLKHTFVPEKHRGKGIANVLARYAMDHARSNDLRIIPTCDFVKAFLFKHPEYQNLVRQG